MQTFRVAAAAICLSIAGVFPAHAAEPVIRLSSSCDMPTMPGKGASKYEWDTYGALVRDYNECLGDKMSGYGSKAKESLEGVGNTVLDLKKSATDFFKR